MGRTNAKLSVVRFNEDGTYVPMPDYVAVHRQIFLKVARRLELRALETMKVPSNQLVLPPSYVLKHISRLCTGMRRAAKTIEVWVSGEAGV